MCCARECLDIDSHDLTLLCLSSLSSLSSPPFWGTSVVRRSPCVCFLHRMIGYLHSVSWVARVHQDESTGRPQQSHDQFFRKARSEQLKGIKARSPTLDGLQAMYSSRGILDTMLGHDQETGYRHDGKEHPEPQSGPTLVGGTPPRKPPSSQQHVCADTVLGQDRAACMVSQPRGISS